MIDTKLQKLRDNVSYLEWKYESCHRFWKNEYLTEIRKVHRLELKWLLKAYENTSDKTVFFNDFFTKLAGTKKLREQIEAGMTEKEIRKTNNKIREICFFIFILVFIVY